MIHSMFPMYKSSVMLDQNLVLFVIVAVFVMGQYLHCLEEVDHIQMVEGLEDMMDMEENVDLGMMEDMEAGSVDFLYCLDSFEGMDMFFSFWVLSWFNSFDSFWRVLLFWLLVT